MGRYSIALGKQPPPKPPPKEPGPFFMGIDVGVASPTTIVIGHFHDFQGIQRAFIVDCFETISDMDAFSKYPAIFSRPITAKLDNNCMSGMIRHVLNSLGIVSETVTLNKSFKETLYQICGQMNLIYNKISLIQPIAVFDDSFDLALSLAVDYLRYHTPFRRHGLSEDGLDHLRKIYG
jgi:hypothetical protein